MEDGRQLCPERLHGNGRPELYPVVETYSNSGIRDGFGIEKKTRGGNRDVLIDYDYLLRLRDMQRWLGTARDRYEQHSIRALEGEDSASLLNTQLGVLELEETSLGIELQGGVIPAGGKHREGKKQQLEREEEQSK